MNENNSFSSYDGYYCNNNFQFTDLTTPLDVNSTNHYFSSITEEFSSIHPPTSISTAEPTPNPLQTVRSNNVNHLPFVQIHTTNAQPSNNNFGNIFRRQQNHEEIKSEEPIKSEQSEAAATSNATQQQNQTNIAPECQTNSTGHVTPNTPALHTKQPQFIPEIAPVPVVQKCTQCPYLCLQADSLEKHVAASHLRKEDQSETQRKKIVCPGCENIFYAKESLEVHLLSDHFMCKEDMKQILPDLSEDQPRKSRIYLKNVEFLREPARSEQMLNLEDQGLCSTFQNTDGNNLIDLICDDSDVLTGGLPSISVEPRAKQKISIKSVDVLREPALMQREEHSGFDFLPQTTDQNDILCLDNEGITRYPNFAPQSDLPELCSEEEHNNQTYEKPRRPKIYIKNVDILKEPIFLPPSNLTNVLNVNDDLRFNLFPPDDELQGSKFIEGINNEYSFDCSNNFVECANFLLPIEDSSFLQQDAPKSKIYIKDVDIMKQPQFQEHPRRSTNFLHLRTVDELNLMNKNEVENLIAPNLEQNMGNIPNLGTHSSENSKHSEEVCAFRVISQDSNSFNKPTDFQTPPTISWSNDYVLDGLDSIIDSNSECEQKNRHYDLNTPQISIMDEVNDVVDNHDPEILFVCAEELINANRENEELSRTTETETERLSFEIVEIMDDLEKDQPNRKAETGPSNCPQSEKSEISEVEGEAISEDVDLMGVSHEKGRIYVADNLMEVEKDVPSLEGSETYNEDQRVKPKPRGRPFGSNRTGITKLRKMFGSTSHAETENKCEFDGCSFRFKKPETSEYHKRCHNTEGSHPMVCPECKSTNFSNWNTLHTHLWRSHKIDMELYSCDLCNFKTPIYSRLVNTHSKIHSEERNYKCDQCEKAFKNSKQLKNHRRWHRTIAIAPPPDVHRCEECGSAFSHLKTLREHFCKGNDLFCCDICGKTLSSKSSLKLHMLTHESAKKFKCESCDYMANDHNAFRRHRMTHDKSKMYICPLCDYKSIQSVAFQKHIRIKHPESADTIVHTCKFCPFATINEGLLTVHLAKHKLREEHVRAEGKKERERSEVAASETFDAEDGSHSSENNHFSSLFISNISPASAPVTNTDLDSSKTTESLPFETDSNQQPRNKIKVKSDLVLTDPTRFSSNVISPLLLHCFDTAIR